MKFINIADIAGQAAVFHMVDEIDDLVGKRQIVRNQNKSILIVLQISFQPLNMLFVKIVGRLIQKQDIRFFQQQFRQQDLGPLTAGQFADIPIQADIAESERLRDFLNLDVNLIKIMVFKRVLPFTDLFEQFIHFFFRTLHHLRIAIVDLLLYIK